MEKYLRSRIITVLTSRRGEYLTLTEIEAEMSRLEGEKLREAEVKAGVVTFPEPSNVLAQLAEENIIGSRSKTNPKGETEILYGVD